MTAEAIIERLQRLEDIEEIRRLKAHYCAACDDDHDPDKVISLFVPDGVWEASGIGRFEGHAQIHRYMANLRASGRIRNSAHNVFNPDIEVHGDTATGHWRLIMLYTGNVPAHAGDVPAHAGDVPAHAGDVPAGTPGGPAGVQYFRIIGWYREHYVRTADGWRYQSLYCQVEENAAYPIEASRLD